MTNKAILYERFSPRPDSAECESLAVQHERLCAYCRMAGLEVAHVIEEPDVSAAIPLGDRQQGELVVKLAGRKGVKHIVVQRLDRIFRNAADCLNLIDKWDKAGVTVHFADQGGCTIDASTAFGRQVIGLEAVRAEYERRLNAERTSGAMRHHQKNGRSMSARLPYGKMAGPPISITMGDGSQKERRMHVDEPEEQENIALMVQLREAGDSYQSIAASLNSQGRRCRGRTWHGQTIRRILRRASV